MAFEIPGGQLGELKVAETKVAIGGFEEDIQDIVIDLPVSGPLRDMLLLLDHERLRLVEPIGIDPQATAGLGATRTNFRFPLIAALTLDDLEVVSRANLADVAVDDLILGQNARKGSLSLELDKTAMTITGTVELGTVPIELEWNEAFSDEVPERSRIKALAASFSEAQRKAFGFDVWPYFHGPVSASVVAQLRRDGTTAVNSAVNIRDAELGAPFLHWSKPPGVEGEARLSLLLAGERLVALRSLAIDTGPTETGSLTLRADGRFAADGSSLAEINLEQLAFGGTDVSGVQVLPVDGGYDVQIAGGVVDAAPFIAANGTSGQDGEPAESEEDDSAIRLRAPALESVYFGEGRYLETVSLELERDAAGWQKLQMRGLLPASLRTEPGPAPTEERPSAEQQSEEGQTEELPAVPQMTLDYGPSADGPHRLEVIADDLGGFLRALDIRDTIRGGTLTVTGEEPPGQPMRARFEAKDFTVVEAPALARLLLVASLTGVLEGLRGEGIAFQRLVGETDVKDGVMTSDLVRAYGTSIGITAKGKLDINASTLDITGTIVPAYLLNRILGEIPILGPILTGGEGEGFVAFNYAMNGDLAEPEVSVNALSALAPGFLRNLFSGDLSDGEPFDLPQGTDR